MKACDSFCRIAYNEIILKNTILRLNFQVYNEENIWERIPEKKKKVAVWRKTKQITEVYSLFTSTPAINKDQQTQDKQQKQRQPTTASNRNFTWQKKIRECFSEPTSTADK